MAAYALLVSLMHTIDQIENHPYPPISIDKQQVQSLTETVTFLTEFLERYNSAFAYSEESDPLENRIADAACAAADVIESHIVGTIHSDEQVNCINFYQDLQQVIDEMDLIKEVVMETKAVVVERKFPASITSLRPSSITSMVGFDEVLFEVMDKLTGGQLNRQVISIVGMGGIGKTTLAKNVYEQPLIKEHFDICAWTTISQEYNKRDILSDVFSQAAREGKEKSSLLSEEDIGLALYKDLSHRRFLIVMDDMWSLEAWNMVQRFFPENNNGSRIVVTTRLSKLGSHLDREYGIEMRFLDKVSSWNLFSKVVFGENKNCPSELKEVGERIVENCKGLPLSIVVMAGLLEKLDQTQECWQYVSKNLVNLENDEVSLRILEMSYDHLPIYLKPCFLYVGMFKEDRAIRVSKLINLWVCEGFLKPINGKTMETVAKEYLKDLIDRNLLLVHSLGSTQNIKYIIIHDLLRDVSLREARKQRFDHFMKRHSSRGEGIVAFNSIAETPSLRMLKILKATKRSKEYFLEDVLKLVNLRSLSVRVHYFSKFPSSVNLLWGLHTLIVIHPRVVNAPVEIWKMTQLRHVKFINAGVCLPHPTTNIISIMENLQTLDGVVNFKCGKQVMQRLPNIKKLCISLSGNNDYCLNNLEHLHKLESFWCQSWGSEEHLYKFSFPNTLKKLHLEFINNFYWEELLEKIGSLPYLERLTLKDGCFGSGEWETVEGQFRRLIFLLLDSCLGLENWNTSESSHFPRLEDLRLFHLPELEEIPSAIGEIPTLRLIKLVSCSKSASKSAKNMEEEQQDLQGEQISFQVSVS